MNAFIRRLRRSLPSLSARLHIAFGLSSLLSTIVLVASFSGIVPDRAATVREGRLALSEAMASAGSMLLRRGDVDGLRRTLEFTVERNPDLLGVTLQRGGGGAATTFGLGASGNAPPATGAPVDASSVAVPLMRAGRDWGRLHFRFADPAAAGLARRMHDSPFAPVVFIALAGFVAFYVYLGKVLKQLDPSAAVPGRVRSALDSIAECLVVVDRRGDLVLANAAFAELAGEEAAALLGRPLSGLGWVNEPGSDARPWAAALERGEPVHQAMAAYTDARGARRRFIVNCSPVLDPKGGVGGVLVSMDDVTRLEEQEILLRESMRAAEDANAAKTAFLSNMSHEIRTPMTAILGFTDVLRRGAANDPATRERHLETISSSGRHLLELINDLLDLSKVEAGSMDVESIETAAASVVGEVVEVLGVKAREKGVGMSVEIETPLPRLVASDPARLRQIVTNLAGNAIKFTESGAVRVRLAWVPATGTLRIAVTDSGIGMTEAQQAGVFDAFTQADVSITRRFGGTGLGLSISLRLAEALGGTIALESVPGEGSTFTLVLPGLTSLSGAPESPEALRASLRTTDAVPERELRLRPANVLVVDDAQENRELLSLVLGGAGLRVSLACDGAEAVQAVRAGAPELVLMDIQMPVMDGYEAVGHMRSDGYGAPVIALTANAMQGFETRVLAAGFSHYETKPIDIDRLLGLLARLLGEIDPVAAPDVRDTVPGDAPVAAAKGMAAQATEEPLVASALAAKDTRFASIAERFLERLDDELGALRPAVDAADVERVADRAHWLKGSGGTVGYACLGEPSALLEQAARSGDGAGMKAALARIEALHARLVVLPGDARRVVTVDAVTERPFDHGGGDASAANIEAYAGRSHCDDRAA